MKKILIIAVEDYKGELNYIIYLSMVLREFLHAIIVYSNILKIEILNLYTITEIHHYDSLYLHNMNIYSVNIIDVQLF